MAQGHLYLTVWIQVARRSDSTTIQAPGAAARSLKSAVSCELCGERYPGVRGGEGLTLLWAALVESKYSPHFILEEVVHHFSFRIYTYDH